MLHQYCQMVQRLQKRSTSQHLSDIGDGMCILSEAVFTWPVSKSYRYESEVCEVQYRFQIQCIEIQGRECTFSWSQGYYSGSSSGLSVTEPL